MSGALDPRSALHAPARRQPPWLRAVPDVDSAQLLGPQHAAIADLIRAVTRLTPEQDAEIEARWYHMRGPERFRARSQASQAASRHQRLEAQLNARQRAWGASNSRCRDAAGDAAHALAVRDLIGDDFPSDAYAELVGPWVSVMGVAHPEDPPATDRTGESAEP